MTPTPKTIQQLIEKLSDKSLTLGCKVRIYSWSRKESRMKYRSIQTVVRNFNNKKIIVTRGQKGTISIPIENCTPLGHPVMLGDVLERIRVTTGELNSYRETTLLWEPCGFNKSLQEIFDSAEWEDTGGIAGMNAAALLGGVEVEKRIKDPHTRELFEYLCSLFLKD